LQSSAPARTTRSQVVQLGSGGEESNDCCFPLESRSVANIGGAMLLLLSGVNEVASRRGDRFH
jgi:hypothetical protein